jgi:arylsulfatase A-like enzyme
MSEFERVAMVEIAEKRPSLAGSGRTDARPGGRSESSQGHPTVVPPAPSARPSPGPLATAAWLGLVVGLVEVGILLVEMYRNRIATIGALRLNRHYPWMIPLAYLALFAAFGLALEAYRRIRPASARRLAPIVLGSVAVLGLLLAFRVLSTIACVLLACGIASRLIPRLDRFGPAFSSLVRASLLPLGLGLIGLVVVRHAQFAWAEHKALTKPPAVGMPNVLFLVLDTVRAKSLGMYGYGRDTSPRLDRLARSGVRFAEARATAPWTLPSHAGMFTGRWPSELFQYHEQRLDASVPTLAGYLGQKGYATAGFVANTFYCNAGFGLSSGFDHYEDFDEICHVSPGEILRNAEAGRRLKALIGGEGDHQTDGRKDADRINADFLEWLPTRGDRPFFAFLNYLDTHAPYFPPAGADRHFGLRPTTPADFQLLTKWQDQEHIPGDGRQIQMARDGYDDCLAYLDGALGRLFDELERRKLLDETLIVVVGDHGEQIGEHRLVGHGRSLYRDELRVPLLVVKPGKVPSGQVVAEPVSLRDLPATVLDLLGLAEKSPFPGRSLAPLWTSPPGSPRPVPGLVKSEVAIRAKTSRNASRPPALRGPMVSVVAEGMTYIRNANGDEELYRLLDDPEEAKNLAEVEALRPTLERLRDLAGPMDSR